uniref:Protein-tyrosine-phosphatase n=2 Tax=Ascaris TaxID=6251 RepID=A0A9J2PJQ1_ASCLU
MLLLVQFLLEVVIVYVSIVSWWAVLVKFVMAGRDVKTAIMKIVRGRAGSKRRRTPAIRRRFIVPTSRSATSEEDGTQMERVSHRRKITLNRKASEHPEKLNLMRNFCLTTVKLGVAGLVKEFMEIKATSTPIAKLSKVAFDKNKDKNRYKDVFCIDGTRVVLQYPPGGNDYIHANYVGVRNNKRRFICTQAPKENTVADFWRMVWQEKSKAIIMLCNIMECGKKKCEQYWPPIVDDTMNFGELTIKNVKMVEVEKIISVTRLNLSDGSYDLDVEHIAWRSWPDRGVPENFLACFRLLQRVKDVECIVVHCSAGIGRTGTIVGLEVANQMFDHGEKVSMREIVQEMRKQRHGSVQTDIQYVYMHRCIVGLSENKKAVKRSEVHGFMQQFDQFAKARGAVGAR